jgi:hypothetical protein
MRLAPIAALLAAVGQPAAAATEAVLRLGGEDIRIVAGASAALVEIGGRTLRVDPIAGTVDGKPVRLSAPGSFALTRWAPGPAVAGHASTFFILMRGETVCAEVLVSEWMHPFTADVVAALDLALAGLGREIALTTAGCGTVAVTTLAGAGWPLMVGDREAPVLETTEIRFGVEPAQGRGASASSR